MGQVRSKRLSPDVLREDRTALVGIQSLVDYNPSNPAYSHAKLAQLALAMEAAQQVEMRALHALAEARDAAVDAEHALHEGIQGAKAQVIAQYGRDSQAVEKVGLKRSSERRRPTRRSAPLRG